MDVAPATSLDPVPFVASLDRWQTGQSAWSVPHQHRRAQLAYVRSGRGVYLVGGREYHVEPRTVVVIPAGVMHQVQGDPVRPHLQLTLYFRPVQLAPLGEPAVRYANDATQTVACFPVRGFAADWEHHVESLMQPAPYPRGGALPLWEARLLELCLLTLAGRQRPRPRGPLDHENVDWPPAHAAHIERMIAFVDSHLDRKLRLCDIASAAALDASYASCLFHRATGTRLFDFVAERRAKRAVHLLASTSLKLDEVASRCGFGSVSTLYRCIRQRVGAAPSSLRAR